MVVRWHVSNIPFSATEDDLAKFFRGQGVPASEVKICEYPPDDARAGQSRGFGFVVVEAGENPEETRTRLFGLRFIGRPLTIRVADPPRAKIAQRIAGDVDA